MNEERNKSISTVGAADFLTLTTGQGHAYF